MYTHTATNNNNSSQLNYVVLLSSSSVHMRTHQHTTVAYRSFRVCEYEHVCVVREKGKKNKQDGVQNIPYKAHAIVLSATHTHCKEYSLTFCCCFFYIRIWL